MTKKQLKGYRNINTFAYLKMASRNALEQAQRSESGSFYNLMTSMLCSAFTMEAFFNHIGAAHIKGWDILKKPLSPKEKLDFIARDCNYKIDYGSRPFQTFNDIIRFRNTMVHAESEFLEYPEEFTFVNDIEQRLTTKWEKEIQLNTAKRYFEDILEMMDIICEQYHIDKHVCANQGNSYRHISVVEEEDV